MDYIFLLITLLWIGEFIIFPSKDKDKEFKTKSFSIILVSILSIIIINAIMLLFDVFITHIGVLKISALIIYALGLVLCYYSLILLGKNFTRNVDVLEDQELVSTGTYKYVRHPLYSVHILLFLAPAVIMFVSIDISLYHSYIKKGSKICKKQILLKDIIEIIQ